MLKLEKSQIKIVSIAIVAFFVLGIIGLAVSQTGKGYAAGLGGSSNVGVVDYRAIVSNSQEYKAAGETFKAEAEKASKDLEAKTKGLAEQKKQEEFAKERQRLANREMELTKPIYDKIEATIKSVAEAKSLSVVMEKSVVVYGGQDITDEVTKKINGQ